MKGACFPRYVFLLVLTFFVFALPSVASARTVPTVPGKIVEYIISGGNGPNGIVLGPDGNFWVVETDGNTIDRITPKIKVTHFPIPTSQSIPAEITVGPDGNLWFTEEIGNKIGRITPQGVITEFPVPTNNDWHAHI